MGTEQIDLYLSYFEAVKEAYKIPRPEPFPYSEYQEDNLEDTKDLDAEE